jgi:hypothetical protein
MEYPAEIVDIDGSRSAVAQVINTIGTLFAVATLARIGAKIRPC